MSFAFLPQLVPTVEVNGAWHMVGLKPTQYRCASEALPRRFRKDGALPSIHPLVDLCNAVSLTDAIPIAVFDLDKVTGDLTVRRALGTETYATFGGETENPDVAALKHELVGALAAHWPARRN
jgi:DNA/RNA-binding domain of Phe-tRNA-synthetase-like protein